MSYHYVKESKGNSVLNITVMYACGIWKNVVLYSYVLSGGDFSLKISKSRKNYIIKI